MFQFAQNVKNIPNEFYFHEMEKSLVIYIIFKK